MTGCLFLPSNRDGDIAIHLCWMVISVTSIEWWRSAWAWERYLELAPAAIEG
jgi:hypothetical protein